MSAAPIVLGITIRADGSAQVAGEINRIREAVTGASSAAQGSNREFSAMAQSMASAEREALRLHTAMEQANAIYNDTVARLTLSTSAYRAQQLALQGLHPTQIRHIQALEAEQAAALSGSSAMAGLSSAVGLFGGVLGAVALIAFAKRLADSVEQAQNLNIRLQGLTKSAKDYAEVQGFLTDTSDRFHKKNTDLTESFAALLAIEETGIITRQQSKLMLEGMSNAQSKTGATGDSLRQSMIGLSQALGMGTLAWEEIKQVTEPMPGLMKRIAEAAGFTGESAIGEFKALVAAGSVTSDMFGHIMVTALASYQGAAEKAGGTLTAQYNDVANSWTKLVKVLESPVNDAMSPVLHGIAIIIEDLALGIDAFMKKWAQFSATDFSAGSMRLPGQATAAKVITATSTPTTGVINQDEAATNRASLESVAITAKMAKAQAEQDKVVEKLTTDNYHLSHSKAENNLYDLTAQKLTGDTLTKAVALANANDALSASHKSASTVHKAAMTEEEKAAKSLATAYDNQIGSLLRAIALEGDASTTAAIEYDVQNGALKELSESKKAYLIQETAALANKELETKTNETAKTELAALKDKYDQLTLSAEDYYAAKLKSEGLSPVQAAPLIKQNSLNINVEASNKSTDAARSALEAYNNEIVSTKNSLTDLGATNTAAFQSSLGPMQAVVGLLGDMAKGAIKSSDSFKKLAQEKKDIDSFQPSLDKDKYLGDLKLKHDKETKNEKDTQALQRQTRDQYIEGTGAMASAMASMFLSNKDAQLANQAIALVTLGIQAVLAVVTQGEGDPYTAFARIAAMAAIVAGLVSSVGGKSPNAGGGSIASPTTGTVLGDTKKGSESVKNVYDLLQSIHADEYAELRGINSGVAALSDGITNVITRLFQAGGLKSVELQPIAQGKGPFGGLGNLDLVQMVIRGLFMAKTSQTVVESGIQTQSYQIGQDFKAQQYDVIQTIKKTWLSSKTTFSTQYSALDSATTKAIGSVFDNIGSTMLSVADTLGHQMGKDVSSRVLGYIIPALNIDLKGLSGEDATKKLNGVISTALDTMSTAVFGDILGQYQKLGEGMLETAVRIVSEVAVVKDALATSGLSLATNAIAISDALVQAAGGLAEFQTQFSAYFDKFYTDNQKQAASYKSLSSSLLDVLTVLPQTREGYRKLIEALNLSNPLDQARYSLLIKLSAAADSYYSALEAQMTTAKDNLANAYKTESDALTVTINKFDAFSVSLKSFRDSLLVGDLAASSPADKYRLTQSAFNANTTAVNAGPGTTTASKAAFDAAMGTLQANSQSFLSASRDYSASSLAYAADYGQVIAALNSGISSADAAKSTATLQLDQLTASVSGLITINESVLSVRDAILAIRNIQAGRDSATAAATLAVSKASVPQFAAGGEHSGGWRVVGENGPEIERTGPSRIFSNQQSKSLVNNDDLIAEINRMREEARANALAIAQASAETAKILKRWDGDGMPSVRVLA